MPVRKASWAILVWTVLMAVGILAAALGIGDECVGLSGSDLSACRTDAWTRGGIGLALLLFLWFVGFVPLAIFWFVSRPKENVTVFGPAGQQVMLSEAEARKRVEQQGWTYQRSSPGQDGAR
jgi:hypothetical protein